MARVYILVVMNLISTTAVLGTVCSPAKYNGTVSSTNGGRMCQRWADQVPHGHEYGTSSFFPNDGSIEAANNYCRQVAGDITPWCYTTDKYVRWQYCDAVVCNAENSICGGIQRSEEGFLTSLDGDGNGLYDSLVDCLWTLVAPDKKLIRLQILTFVIRDSDVCHLDFLKVYEDFMIHGVFCGTDGPTIILSVTSVLYIQFHSTDMEEFPGFSANYSHVQISGESPSVYVPPKSVVYGNMTCPAHADLHRYSGEVHTTNSGKECIPWAKLKVNNNPIPDVRFPLDGSAAAANNYCRNLMDELLPWCFTTKSYSQEHCYIQICSGADTLTEQATTTLPASSSTSGDFPTSISTVSVAGSAPGTTTREPFDNASARRPPNMPSLSVPPSGTVTNGTFSINTQSTAITSSGKVTGSTGKESTDGKDISRKTSAPMQESTESGKQKLCFTFMLLMLPAVIEILDNIFQS